MAGNKEKLVIIGDGETGEIAYEYFSLTKKYDIVAFSAEKKFTKNKELFGLPVVPFEELEELFSPMDHKVFVAVSFTQLNRVRTRLFNLAKEKGYSFCSYISQNAFLGENVEIGENCFIFENSTLQRKAKLGNNIVVWSGSFIGHHSIIHDNCFIASHVAISGSCEIGENCFLGVNCCTRDRIKISRDCIIGAGAVLINDTALGRIYVGNPAKPLPNKTAKLYINGGESI